MKDLKQCREEIDDIDQQIIALFEKRMHVAKDVVQYKIANQMEIFQAKREQQVIEKNVKRIEDNNLKEYAKIFIQNMMNISKTYQASFLSDDKHYELSSPCFDQAVIGFQGVPGSFSQQALHQFFGKDAKSRNYKDFKDVFEALQNDEIQYGIVPLENSSTGAINDNYDLIRDYGFYIVGEQSLSISQHLLGIQESREEDIVEVYSHPQGLLQCSQYLRQHPNIHKRECENTALAAQYIADQKDVRLGAIASYEAAKIYNLKVLKENIQNDKSNTTRFIIFSKQLEKTEDAMCVSTVFTLNHEVGALHEVMKIISNHQLNMLRIESRPIIDTPWEYFFYVDFEGSLDDSKVISALEDMKAHTNTFKLLGNYAKRKA